MSESIQALTRARRLEKVPRTFSGITRAASDRLAAGFQSYAKTAGNYNAIVFIGAWNDDGTRYIIKAPIPVFKRNTELLHDYEAGALHVPLNISGFDLFRACRSFGSKMERTRVE